MEWSFCIASSGATAMELCKYAYKTCTNPRDIKRNGDLHKFCAYHRHKANNIHQKHLLKRRMQQRIMDPIVQAQNIYNFWSYLSFEYELDPLPFSPSAPFDHELVLDPFTTGVLLALHGKMN